MKTPLFFLSVLLCIVGCGTSQAVDKPVQRLEPAKHLTTARIDRFGQQLTQGIDNPITRQSIYSERWAAVQAAVAHHGTLHRDAFYTSRSYWHSGSTRGIGWALEQVGDLNDGFYIASKGNVLVTGDVNADIEIAGNSIVHIFGDLTATLELQGVCEVIIAGSLTEDATIICDGQLELFVGGNSLGILGSTESSTLVIDGDAAGTLQAGEPATRLTVTGDLTAHVPSPKNKDAILTLRVDGYASSNTMSRLIRAGFARINATLGSSDTAAGLYPEEQAATRSKVRWVVQEQRVQGN